ncbi:MAG: putative transcriptional regulator [Pseudohongiellaceae bacterium]|jgi:putative transcriptional regulator
MMTNSANFHPSLQLLTEFSQGSLSVGMSVALSAHVELCEICRERSNDLESKAVESWMQISEKSKTPDFTSMMSAIIEQSQITTSAPTTKSEDNSVNEMHMLNHSVALPHVLAKAASQGLVWKKLAGGINQAQVALDNETQCEFIYMTPGSQVPVHRHQGSEVTLVLDGSFSDELGHYKASDFMVRTKENLHRPTSEEGCLCFAVLDSPLTFTKGLARLMNPFIQYKFRKAMAQRA